MLYYNLLASQAKAPTAHVADISDKANLWGAFIGLFGLDNNQFITLTIDPLVAPEGVETVRSQTLVPTARPTDYRPLSRDGTLTTATRAIG